MLLGDDDHDYDDGDDDIDDDNCQTEAAWNTS